MYLRPVNNNLVNIFNDFFNNNHVTYGSFRIDVKENDQDYQIEAELPGVAKEEIKLAYDENYLTITVNREAQNEDEKVNYLYRERKLYSMERSVYLEDVQEENISAKLENGILFINVPKAEKQVKKIEIEVK